MSNRLSGARIAGNTSLGIALLFIGHVKILFQEIIGSVLTGKGETMADIEKVKNALTCCLRIIEETGAECIECPYFSECRKALSNSGMVIHVNLVKDALELLKEQEAEIERLKKPTAGGNKIPLKW